MTLAVWRYGIPRAYDTAHMKPKIMGNGSVLREKSPRVRVVGPKYGNLGSTDKPNSCSHNPAENDTRGAPNAADQSKECQIESEQDSFSNPLWLTFFLPVNRRGLAAPQTVLHDGKNLSPHRPRNRRRAGAPTATSSLDRALQRLLVCTTIVALDLNKKPTNIDNFGLMITLHPRPHKEAGSRFQFISAAVTPMPEMVDKFIMTLGAQSQQGADHGPNLMKLHKQHHDELKERTGGMEDYATMTVVVRNVGEHEEESAVNLTAVEQIQVNWDPQEIHAERAADGSKTQQVLEPEDPSQS
ncbi:hypothetical protein DFH08DRAFT_818955 [Mycena albidolilacea]|uniref:Uncharacterized protein n=1 Tax=Mycena albidolilacea TaxID=1033008 RepID=A0AAD6ZF41_9AGAR|nr:hypothetical protein DFH08DRAFT_818955 [Mycena albidolilacea]